MTGEPDRASRILIVEDDPMLLELASRLLAEAGYGVLKAASAEQAIMLLRDGGGFDAVVTDHGMPGLSGADLIRWIDEHQPELGVVSVSGWDIAAAGGPRAAARRRHLQKPYTREELLGALKAVLRERA